MNRTQETKQHMLETIEEKAEQLFHVACSIFDHPEISWKEFYASDLLAKLLEAEGFSVERGIGGIETAFRATWERGRGGPSIGFMMEYDALEGLGHACGHHLQGPTVIGAALALKEHCVQPFKLVLYGTPAEEVRGGKIDMVNNGCFRDVDVILSYHTGASTCVSYSHKALNSLRVTFSGTPAHASSAPWKGRSAMDAMLLAFHGLEILREHVKDGSRIHYSILQDTGPANIVHKTAKAHITLRTDERFYLEEMRSRVENILKGACLMTDTTYEIEERPAYWNYLPIPTLRERALAIADELHAEKLKTVEIRGNGSTDVGNVSWIVPNLNLYTYFGDYTAHTEAYTSNGKTEQAQKAMLMGSKIFSWLALELIEDSSLLATVKDEHQLASQSTNN